jgi:putative tryptophan/tyrosine transport system substrate-binding protein
VAAFAMEFVRQAVDVIVTYGGTVAALKQTAPSIPIVFALAVDPVGAGLVASLSRPGGNVTGMSLQATDTAGKRLELLREVVPRLRRLAIMFDGAYAGSVRESDQAQAGARMLGFDAAPYAIRRAVDIAPAFEVFKSKVDALYVVEDALISANRVQIVTLALETRLPTSFNQGANVQDGGLMSYGPSYPALFQRAAEIVDKILRGTKPGDIPVQQPTKFELVINLKTVKVLGLTIAPELLAIADDVIE